MKLNKKGFAISSIMYLILILALILVSLTISLIMSRKLIIDKQKKEVLNLIENNLILSKITYIDLPFDSSWTYSNASVDESGILTIGEDGNFGRVTSSYIDVNGGFFYFVMDGYTESASPMFSPKGGILAHTVYYNSAYASTSSLGNYSVNGYGNKLSLGVWTNNIFYKNVSSWKALKRYGPNVKYVKINFTAGENEYSSPPVKIRNLKLYGEEIPNSFYEIGLKLRNNKQIASTKYEKGSKTKSYFQSNGTIVSNTTVTVYENGIYTIYVKDIDNNEYISKIEISNIIE